MSAINKSIIDGILALGTVNVEYTAPALGKGTRITAFTVNNTLGSGITWTAYIVPNGGSPGLTNILVNAQSLDAAEDDQPPALINQLVPPGGTIEVFASSGASLSVRASGIEFV